METKHTKEYAEKMYLKQLNELKKTGFVDGYMKAIEENNVAELLEACNSFIELFQNSDMRPEDECNDLYYKVKEAIEKATT